MSLADPSAETVAKHRATRARGLHAEFRRAVRSRAAADQRLAKIMTDPRVDRETIRVAEVERLWCDHAVEAAAEALSEANDALERVGRSAKCDTETRWGGSSS